MWMCLHYFAQHLSVLSPLVKQWRSSWIVLMFKTVWLYVMQRSGNRLTQTVPQCLLAPPTLSKFCFHRQVSYTLKATKSTLIRHNYITTCLTVCRAIFYCPNTSRARPGIARKRFDWQQTAIADWPVIYVTSWVKSEHCKLQNTSAQTMQ